MMKDHLPLRLFAALFVSLLISASGVYASEMSCVTVATSSDTLVTLGFTSDYSEAICSAELNFRVHVLRQDDGTGGLDSTAVAGIVEAVATDFATADISFRVVSVDEANDSDWYANPIGEASGIFSALDSAGELHLVLGPDIGLPRSKAESIPGTIAVVTGAVAGTSAASHALAHCLGLYDTHEQIFGVEATDGSNGTTAGDRVWATAADPGIAGYVDQNGELTAQFAIDFPGYDPDQTNVMCGGPIEFWTGFAPEQGARMRAAAQSVADIQEALLVLVALYYDKTSQTLMANQYSNRAENASVFDLDHDGDKDMIVTAASATAWKTAYFSFDGVPQFEDDTSGRFEDGAGPKMVGDLGTLLADFDNDGWTDFYVSNNNQGTGGGHRLYRNAGGTFVDVTAATGLSTIVRRRTSGASWADYDQDGYVDLLIRRSNPLSTSEAWALLHNEAAPADSTQRIFVETTGATGMTVNSYDDGSVWADFDDDGDLDLLFVQTRPSPDGLPQSVYLANHNGAFQDVTNTRLFGASAIAGIEAYAAAVDVDNDGDLDVAYSGHLQSGYFLNAGGILTHRWSFNPPTTTIENPYDFEILDFELDGRMDITTDAGPTSTYPHLLRNLAGVDDPAVFGPVTNNAGITSVAETRKSCAADFNRDGYKDYFLGRTSDKTFFYKAITAQGQTKNNWIGIQLWCPGSANNILGIGATVTAHYGTVQQAQIVDGGTGRAVQQEIELVFGLGSGGGSVDIEVRWPDGTTTWFDDLEPNTYHRLADSAPPILRNSPTARVEYLGGGENPLQVDWVFTWETSIEPGDKIFDRVDFDTSQLPWSCYEGRVALQYGDVDVVVADPVVTASGTYLHELRWTDTDCFPGCTIPYTVTSGLSVEAYDYTSTSNPQNLRIRVCLQ